jgi:hypothetical protein
MGTSEGGLVRKIPTLFVRDHATRQLTDTLTIEPQDDWYATGKWDGTAILHDTGGWFARREVKAGKAAPDGWIQVTYDETTGKRVGWEPITDDPQFKWHRQAIQGCEGPFGTYEAIGPHFQGNPHQLNFDQLRPHGQDELACFADLTVKSQIEWALITLPEFEGIVWWDDHGPVAKLKRHDFGLPWPAESGVPAKDGE